MIFNLSAKHGVSLICLIKLGIKAVLWEETGKFLFQFGCDMCLSSYIAEAPVGWPGSRCCESWLQMCFMSSEGLPAAR